MVSDVRSCVDRRILHNFVGVNGMLTAVHWVCLVVVSNKILVTLVTQKITTAKLSTEPGLGYARCSYRRVSFMLSVCVH